MEEDKKHPTRMVREFAEAADLSYDEAMSQLLFKPGMTVTCLGSKAENYARYSVPVVPGHTLIWNLQDSYEVIEQGATATANCTNLFAAITAAAALTSGGMRYQIPTGRQ